MNRTEKRILEFICSEKPASIKNLSKLLKLGVKQNSVETYINGFVRAGYVDPPRFTITDKGREALKEQAREAQDEQV